MYHATARRTGPPAAAETMEVHLTTANTVHLDVDVATALGDELRERRQSVTSVLAQLNLQSCNVNKHSRDSYNWRIGTVV